MIYEFNAAEVFEIAIEIEKNGKRFYEEAREKFTNRQVQDVFSTLALEEVKHEERFRNLKEKLPKSASESTVWDPDNESARYLKMVADTHVFRTEESMEEHLNGIQSVHDALKMAIQFEKDSIILFLTLKSETAEKSGRDQIDQLIGEEQGHLRKLSLLYRSVVK